MFTARWFGGTVGTPRHERVPLGVRLLTTGTSCTWMVGEWPTDEVRTAASEDRTVAVFGPCSITDGQLANLARHKVVDAALTAYAGAYTIVESTCDRTIVLTDPGNVWPIYVARSSAGTTWGSSAFGLARLLGRTPDLEWLIVSVLAPERPDLLTGRSAFAGITRMRPGARITVSEETFAEDIVWQVHGGERSVEEGAKTLRTALAHAVAVRVDPSARPTTDCSGGLDSSSLTLLAANALDRRISGPGRTIDEHVGAVTIHPAGRTSGGDMDYASAVAAVSPRIRHLLCPLEARHLPYTQMTELTPPSDEPALSTVAIARATAEFDLLREVGSDCHLTGDGGDTLVGCHPGYLADLARDRRLPLLFREAVGWGRRLRSPVWPFLADAYVIGSGRGKDARSRDRVAGPDVGWATAQAWTALANVEQARGAAVRATSSLRSPERTATAMQFVGRTARSDVQVAEHYGVRVHNPFVDVRVVDAAMSVSAPLRCSPYSYKPLLVTAMADVLPLAVARRWTKGNFLADHYLGLRQNLAAVKELVNGRLAEEGLVSPARMSRILDCAAAGVPVAFNTFEPVLAAEVWLRAVEKALPTTIPLPARRLRNEVVPR